MNSRIRKNYLFNLAYQIFSMLAPLITTPFVARMLGAEGVGLYSYTYSTATMFVAFAQLGTVTYASREIAYHQNDVKARTKIFWDVCILRFLTTFAALGIYFFAYWNDPYREVFLIQSLCILAVSCDISWFFIGIEQFDKITTRDVLSKIVSIICVFIFVKANQVGLYAFILAAAVIVGRVASWLYLPKYLCKISVRELQPFRNFSVILVFFIPHIATQLYTIVAQVMLGKMMETTVESGYFAQADRIIKLCLAVLMSITAVISPRIARCYARCDWEGIIRYVKKTANFLWMLGLPLACGIFAVIPTVIPWFLGAGYEKVVFLVRVFCILILLHGTVGSIGSIYLVAVEKQKQYALTIVVGTVVNIILNALLITKFQSLGAAIASLFAELVIDILLIYMMRDRIRLSYLLSPIVKYIAPSAAMLGVVMLLLDKVGTGFTDTVLLVAVGMAVYFGLLLVFKEPFFMENLRSVLSSALSRIKKKGEK